MNIRLQGNHLRLRLTPEEVKTFEKEGFISDETPLPGGSIGYTLLRSEEHGQVHVQWFEQTLIVFVPEVLGQQWCSTDLNGFDAEVAVEGGEKLAVRVEKDLNCKGKE